MKAKPNPTFMEYLIATVVGLLAVRSVWRTISGCLSLVALAVIFFLLMLFLFLS